MLLLLLSVPIMVEVPLGEVCETSYCVETDVLSWRRTGHAKATMADNGQRKYSRLIDNNVLVSNTIIDNSSYYF